MQDDPVGGHCEPAFPELKIRIEIDQRVDADARLPGGERDLLANRGRQTCRLIRVSIDQLDIVERGYRRHLKNRFLFRSLRQCPETETRGFEA
jgi:hypothetical protein